MASLLDLGNKLKNLFSQGIGSVANTLQQPVPSQIPKGKPLINTPLSKAKSLNYSNIPQSVLKYAPNLLNLPANPLSPAGQRYPDIPKVNLPKINTGAVGTQLIYDNLVKPLTENVINTPHDLIQAHNQITKDFQTGEIKKPKVAVSDVAMAAIPSTNIFSFGGGSIGKNIFLNTAKNAVIKNTWKGAGKEMLKGVARGAVEGGSFTGVMASLSSLADGRDKNFKQQVLDSIVAGGKGTIAGIALGGTIGGIGNVVGQIKSRIIQSRVVKGEPLEIATQKADIYLRDRMGKFLGLKKNQPFKAAGGKLVNPKDSPIIHDWKNEIDNELGVNLEEFNKGSIKLNAKIGVKSEKKGQIVFQNKPQFDQQNQVDSNILKNSSSNITQKGLKISTQAKTKLPPLDQTSQQVKEFQMSNPEVYSQKGVDLVDNAGGNGNMPSKTPYDSSKYAYNINKSKLQMNKSQKKALDFTVTVAKPELERVKGKKISNSEIVKAAKTAEVLSQVTSRDQTLQAEAAILRARQRVVSLNNTIDNSIKDGKINEVQSQMKDLIESIKIVSSTAADTGRRLQSFNITAGDESVRTAILKDVTKTGASTDEILKAAQGVDWNNAQSITSFYRKFIKPSFLDVLDEYRYNNMLSNPKTHLRNAFSNLTQTFITRPTTILVEGKPVEAGKYFTGALKSIPNAIQAFKDSFNGKSLLNKPDIDLIPTNKLPSFLTIPTRTMEAGDKFFTALIEGGEIARGASAAQAAKTAEYSLFRQGINQKGQGKILNAIDSMTAWTYKAPRAIRWFVPFVRTPMNFAKQWIEYSPTGFSTVFGAENPREQVAKAVIGSTVSAFGAMLALEGNTTWAAPTDAKQKEYFYATGRKPFSIKIGNSWIPMQYAGPFALALALPAAAKFYQEDSRTALSDSQIEKMLNVSSSMAQYFSQQTFLTGIGNFVNWASGDADYSLPSNLGFTAQQIIPMEALISYVNQLIDPVYRKSNTFTGSIQKNIPGLSQQLPAYTNPTGEPSKRLPINYILPYDVGQEKGKNQGMYEQFYKGRTTQLQENATINNIKKQLENNQVSSQGKKSSYIINGTEYRGYESGGKFIYQDENGEISTKSIKDIKISQLKEEAGLIDAQYSLSSDRLKRVNDYTTWSKTTKTYINYLKKYQNKLDKKKNGEEIIRIQNKIEDLQDKLNKYGAYGGFKKGKKIRLALPSTKVPTLQLSKVNSANKVRNLSFKTPSPPRIKISFAKKGNGKFSLRPYTNTILTKSQKRSIV